MLGGKIAMSDKKTRFETLKVVKKVPDETGARIRRG